MATQQISGDNLLIVTEGTQSATLKVASNPLDISVEGQDNSVLGGSGNDNINCAGSNASIVGGSGSDTIESSGSGAVINGGSGNDSIKSTGANALINGGDGDDTIEVSGSNATVSGGDGADVFIYSNQNADLLIEDYSKSDYEDILQIDAGAISDITTTGSGRVLTMSSGKYITLKGSANSVLHLRDASGDTISSSQSGIIINGTGNNDSIIASGSNVNINTGNGSATINATGSGSTINSGANADYINVSGANSSVNAGAGNNTISAGDGATIQAGSDNDIVTISDNSLYIYTGGNDTLNGYTEKSRIKIQGSEFTSISGSADTSTGLVTITFSDSNGDKKSSLSIADGINTVINIIQNDETAVGFIYTGKENKIQTKYNVDSNKTVTGDEHDNYIISSGSNNILKPGAGDDTVKLLHSTGDVGSVINYTEGNDVVIGFDAIDEISLNYNDGAQTIGAFYSGNDLKILNGTDTDSVLTLKDVKNKNVNVTREGDPNVTAVNGNVTLQGASVFYYKAGSGNTLIDGYSVGNSIIASTDTNVTNAAIKNDNVIFAMGNSSLTVKDGASIKLNIVGYGAQEYGGKSIEVRDSDGDTINAILNASVVTIDGAESRNASVYLIGNKNNNNILGTKKASSTLYGGTGNDTLTGGTASDTFIYSSGKDVITDYFGYTGDLSSTIDTARYETDTDVIQLSTGSISTYSISGQDVTFTIGTGSLTVKNGKNKKITFLNAAGEIDTGTTKIYRSQNEFVVTADSISSLTSAQSITADDITGGKAVTVTSADSKVTFIDANLEFDRSSVASLSSANLYISGNSAIANTLKASRYGKDTLVGGTKADTLVGSGTLEGAETGSDTYLYEYGQGKDVIVNYKEADRIYFTSTDTSLTSSTIKGGNVTFTVTNLSNKKTSTFVVNDVADKNITFENENGKLYSQVFGTTAITVGDEDPATIDTKPNTAVKTIDASTRNRDVYILGNAKANSIKAGKGYTTLQGGTGNDTLDGGTEANEVTFAFGSNEGTGNVIKNYTFESDTIKVLSGALTATATMSGANANNLTFTIGKTKVKVENAKGKAISVVDSAGLKTTQIYGVNAITVADKDADANATVNTAANSTVVTIDAAARNNAVYLAGNAKANVIVAGKGNETVATAGGKDTVEINNFESDQHLIITDYVAGTDKIKLGKGIYIADADTIQANGTITGSNATLAADTVLLTLASETGNATITSYLAIEGAITTKKGKTTHGKITVIDDTKGITYSQAYSSPELVVANVDGATIDTNGNKIANIVNAKKRTSKVAIIGNEKINSIVGGTKADTIYAGITNGNITINGAAGNDSIIGTLDDSDTSVYALGGAGNDTVIAGLGKNTISGGKGNDVFVYEVKEGKGNQGGEDIIIDFATGTNKLYLESGTTLAASSVSNDDTYLTVQGASADDYKVIKLEKTNGKKITIYDGTTGVTTKQAYGIENITVVNGDAETIDASAAYNSKLKVINAKKVTKSIYLIGNENDGSRIIGGTKADTIKSGKGNTSITGGAGNDVFIYGGGADTITDYSVTSKNNDVLQFAAGNPTYYHVEGKNVVLEFSDTKTVTTNTLTIVNGKDKKFNYNGWIPSTTSFGDLDPTFDGTFDDYTQLVLTKATTQFEAKAGTTLDYRTTYINASKNNEGITIWGNNSDSTIIASTKADNVKGGSKNDRISTGGGKDTIFLSEGNDTITDYAVGSDVIDLNGFTLKSVNTAGNLFTVEKAGVESTFRLANITNKKVTIKDGNSTTSQVYGANSIAIAGGDGADGVVFDLSTSINERVRTADASKRKANQAITIKGNSDDNVLKGGAGNDTLIAGASGNNQLIGNAGNDTLIGGKDNDSLIGGAGNDSLVAGSGNTFFDPGKGDDTIVISKESGRGSATITYTAGGDNIQNYKHDIDVVNMASSVKATTAKKKTDGTYTINFKGGGTLTIGLADGEQASDTFKITNTTVTKVNSTKTKVDGKTVYDWTVNYYVSLNNGNIKNVKIENLSNKVSQIAKEEDALAAAKALKVSYEERFYSELFADDVLASTDDLAEITTSDVDKAAIAVDLTTNSLTDFKVDSESLNTITQSKKDNQ